jgi:hypothetical protein
VQALSLHCELNGFVLYFSISPNHSLAALHLFLSSLRNYHYSLRMWASLVVRVSQAPDVYMPPCMVAVIWFERPICVLLGAYSLQNSCRMMRRSVAPCLQKTPTNASAKCSMFFQSSSRQYILIVQR